MEKCKERRIAPDGEFYTHDEFFQFYGGDAEWNAAFQELTIEYVEERVAELAVALDKASIVGTLHCCVIFL